MQREDVMVLSAGGRENPIDENDPGFCRLMAASTPRSSSASDAAMSEGGSAQRHTRSVSQLSNESTDCSTEPGDSGREVAAASHQPVLHVNCCCWNLSCLCFGHCCDVKVRGVQAAELDAVEVTSRSWRSSNEATASSSASGNGFVRTLRQAGSYIYQKVTPAASDGDDRAGVSPGTGSPLPRRNRNFSYLQPLQQNTNTIEVLYPMAS
jgi:hypothetical protein